MAPSCRSAISTMPERATAALTTSAEATMMTMSSLKPVKASSAGTMPDGDGREERQHRHEVVAEAAPDEEAPSSRRRRRRRDPAASVMPRSAGRRLRSPRRLPALARRLRALRGCAAGGSSGALRLRCGSEISRSASCICSGLSTRLARSPIVTMPTGRPFSSDGHAPDLPLAHFARRRLSTLSSALQVKSVGDITSRTGTSAGLRPSTTTRRMMSRSVRTPSSARPCRRATAPTSSSAICVAASCTVADGSTGSTPAGHHLGDFHATAAPRVRPGLTPRR